MRAKNSLARAVSFCARVGARRRDFLPRATATVAVVTAVGCSIYSSSLLVSAPPDAGLDSPIDSPPADATGDVVDSGVCETGAKSCAGNTPVVCVNGTPLPQQTCPGACSQGNCVTLPSCDGGGAGADLMCGQAHNEDCCATLPVPATTYYRSNQLEGGLATVSGFNLDTFEVTVGRFRKFVGAGEGTQMLPPAAGAGANPKIPGSGWNTQWNGHLPADSMTLETVIQCNPAIDLPTWTPTPQNDETLPINCVNWYEAFAFCIWDGGRLPTEAEWNLAAASDEQRFYPWSNPPDSSVIDPTYLAYNCTAHGGPPIYDDSGSLLCGISDILPPGTRSPKGNGKYGHADLAGNMDEWVLDWYAPYGQPCTDCANLDGSADASKIERGGAYWLDQTWARTALRVYGSGDGRDDGTGIRCAR